MPTSFPYVWTKIHFNECSTLESVKKKSFKESKLQLDEVSAYIFNMCPPLIVMQLSSHFVRCVITKSHKKQAVELSVI